MNVANFTVVIFSKIATASQTSSTTTLISHSHQHQGNIQQKDYDSVKGQVIISIFGKKIFLNKVYIFVFRYVVRLRIV
jgi:hypothetical protein